MKLFGTIFLYIGTIGGLIAAARIPPYYEIFWGSLAILIIGILMRRWTGRPKLIESGYSDFEEMREYLKHALREIQSLLASRDVLTLESLHKRIDRISNEHFYNFGQSCSSLKSFFGIRGYNSVMAHFALAERYINRVWSASTDGYLEESLDYLEKAEPELKDAIAVIDRLHNQSKG